ncbi:MAG: iron ABC transporter permease [Desulfobacterales bacterium]|nr:iron ABC transporter permease [Desulfobacterales bacterium]
MTVRQPHVIRRMTLISLFLMLILIISIFLAISVGAAGGNMKNVFQALLGGDTSDSMLKTIIWDLRFPRALLAALVGATLSLGGLVFQALLRNPLAEPYILGVSGGSAIGAILGILLGLSNFPGVSFTAFLGSMGTLFLVLMMSSGASVLKKDSLLLAGVMINAFCSAVIMFMVSLVQDSRLHNIIFWLMGDLSMAGMDQVGILSAMLIPCFILMFRLSHDMNLLLMGSEMAMSMGVHIKVVTYTLLIVTSFMVSATVSQCGLLGFVGLIIPHMLRMIFGPDHRVLVPACILGGASYMVLCDLLARVLSRHGELPVGVITAMIGVPLFIYLLMKSKQ